MVGVVAALLVFGALGGALWVVAGGGDGGDDARPADDAAGEVLVDAAGEPLLTEDGEPFPAGSRRDGDRVVTPDGTLWERDPRTGRWRPSAGSNGAGGTFGEEGPRPRDRRGRVDVVAPPPPEPRIDLPPTPTAPPEVAGPRIRPPPVVPGLLGTVGNALGADAAVDGAVTLRDIGSADASFSPPNQDRPAIASTLRPDRRVLTERERASAENDEVAVAARRGLRGDYYDFLEGDIRTIPDLAEVPPSFSRIDLEIDFDRDEDFLLPFEPETFAALWRGYVRIDTPGTYRFTVGSDDGMRLVIADSTVVEHTGLRAYGESTGEVTLDAGTHPISLVFYENYIFASCRLFWSGPGFGRRLVPRDVLSPPDEVADVVAPHVTTVTPPSARLEDEVVIRGVGFADTPALNYVTFAGVPAQVVSAKTDELVVRVPIGAETGTLLVQVGPLSSLPRSFEVESANGLFAEYFVIGSELSDYPDMDRLAPYFVRLDGPLDFHQDGLWNLPYEPDVFAARYTGYLWFPQDEDVRITLGSDDGTRVVVDGETFVEDPGLHAYREVARTAHFTRGFHPIEIVFFENRGVARLRLFWERAGDAERTLIPRGFFFPPEAVATAPQPVLTTESLAAEVGEEIVIEGSDLGRDGLTRVLFPGDVWRRPTMVTPDRLTVTVPDGVETGELRVAVGIRESAAIPFERRSLMGMTAKWYLFGSRAEIEAIPSFPDTLGTRATNLERIETDFNRKAGHDWDLPFTHRNAVVHLRGRTRVDVAQNVLFILRADDGAMLFVDGKPVVDLRGFGGVRERSGRVVLTPGEHVFDLYHWQTSDEKVLQFLWSPHGLHDHRAVPARWFRPE